MAAQPEARKIGDVVDGFDSQTKPGEIGSCVLEFGDALLTPGGAACITHRAGRE